MWENGTPCFPEDGCRDKPNSLPHTHASPDRHPRCRSPAQPDHAQLQQQRTYDAPVLSYDPTTGDGISIPNWDFIGNAVVTDDCEDLDCSLVHPHLQLAHGAASSIFNRTALAAATHHQYQRNCWLTRSRFPVVALAPSQTSV